MAGIDDNADGVGVCEPFQPTPPNLFSSSLADDTCSRSFSDFPQEENRSKGLLSGSENQNRSTVPSIKDGAGDEISWSLMTGVNSIADQKSASRGGLTERIAARAGFNAPKLNTTKIKYADLLSLASPEGHSSYVTIPPGLSPTTLLDSPVFLSNAMAQQSPTTGKFPLTQGDNRSSFFATEAPDKNKHEASKSVSFVFKPQPESYSLTSQGNKMISAPYHHQTLTSMSFSVPLTHPFEATETHSKNQLGLPELMEGENTFDNNVVELKKSFDVGNADNSLLPDDQDDAGDQRGDNPSLAVNGPSEDGYNWRKYGQKQVKGSEFPRSYYKCTHPSCAVKKKVERSHEGHITEIIYKGTHNHPKPPPNRRLVVGSSQSPVNMDVAEQPGAQGGFGGESMWADAQQEAAPTALDWRHDGIETLSSASVPHELDASPSMLTQNNPHFETPDPIDISSTFSKEDDDDERATHGSISLGCEEDGDESESKRRKTDCSILELSGATRAVREPRVVVQTTSEVDILDDGYRWRKYGQKVVKGNPNPRSYYKCTNPGCTVRKHVERASHDLKSVITTYEGKHNHDVPAARNSSQANPGATSLSSTPAMNSTRPDPSPSQLHHSMARFDGPPLGRAAPMGMARPLLGPISGFNAFGMSHLNLNPGQMRLPFNIPVMQPYLNQQHKLNETVVFIPKTENKDHMSHSGIPVPSTAAAAYNQMMNRLPLGPHL